MYVYTIVFCLNNEGIRVCIVFVLYSGLIGELHSKLIVRDMM